MRKLLDRWPRLGVLLALLGVAIPVAFLIRRVMEADKRPPGELWFYDLKTARLFPASDLSVPPIDTKSGPATGVRAHVFTCDAASPPTNFIAFLEKLTPGARHEVAEEMRRSGGEAGIGFALEKRPGEILVSAVEKEEWFQKFSPEGARIMAAGKMKGGCVHPRPSLP